MRASGSLALRYVVAVALLPGCSRAARRVAPGIVVGPLRAYGGGVRGRDDTADPGAGAGSTARSWPGTTAAAASSARGSWSRSTTRTRRAGTLRIAVNRLPASGDRRGSLLVNPGGPGASGLRLRPVASSIDSAVRQRYDVVGFDPRGVGASRSIDCLTDRPAGHVHRRTTAAPTRRPRRPACSRQGELLGAGCQRNDPTLLGRTSAPATSPATWTCCAPHSATVG